MTRRSLAAVLLLLAACGEREAPAAPEAPAPIAPEAPAAAAAPRSDGFVGRWAASPELCTGGAWVFAPSRLVTAGEVSCDFRRIDADAQGWTIAADCMAQAPPAPATLRLARAVGGGLTVSGGPFRQPVTLRLCAENWGAAPAGTATATPTNP